MRGWICLSLLICFLSQAQCYTGAPYYVTFANENGGSWTTFTGAEYIDVNGDGILDLVYSYVDYSGVAPSSRNEVYLGNGEDWKLSQPWRTPFELLVLDNHDHVWNQATRGAFIDLNGDGLIDILYSSHSNPDADIHAGISMAFLNTGEGWKQSDYYPQYPMWEIDHYVDTFSSAQVGNFLDLNGDGCTDIIYSNLDLSSQGATMNHALINDCHSGFHDVGSKYTLPFSLTITNWNSHKWSQVHRGQFHDLNLDGLSDVMFSYMDYSTHALTTCGAYLNQGNGSWEFSYSYHTDYDISIAMSALWQGDVHDNTITEATRGEFIDVNGDDFIDLVYSVVDYSSQHLTFERIYINNSTGFEYTSDWSLPDALYAIDYHDNYWTTAKRGTFTELNGDYAVDVIYSNYDWSGKSPSVQETYLNTLPGWRNSPSWSLSDPVFELEHNNGWSYVKRAEFKDLEGNTLDDAIYSESDLSSKKTTIALLKYNNGTDWQ